MTLNHIAADLRRQAETTGQPAKTRLPRGLALSYKRIDRQCTLSAGRQDVFPSTDEAIIIARAFAVPLGTEPTWATISARPANAPLSHPGRGAGGEGSAPLSPVGGRGAGGEGKPWHTITWHWIEIDQPTQPALLPAQTTYP